MRRSRRTARISPAISYAKTGGSTAGVRRVITFVYFLVLSIFLIVTSAAAVSTYQGLRTHGFIETSGVVTEREVSSRRRHGMTRRIKSHIRNRVRHLDVTYTYEFQGFTYEGHQIEAGTFGMMNGDVLRRFGKRLEVGRTVPVYVDPSDHRNAVLERGLSSMTTMFYALFGVFALITLILRVFYVAITTDAQPGQPGAKVGSAPLPR
jgi:hypothetical protein